MNSVRELVTKHEGVRLVKYQDTNGHWTVGVGHNLDAHPLDPGQWVDDDQTMISPETCDQLLDQDLAAAAAPLQALGWFVALDEVRQAVLIDMSFQLGWAGLRTFATFLGMMSAGNYSAAATDLLTTKLAAQAPVREAENAQMLRTGAWPS